MEPAGHGAQARELGHYHMDLVEFKIRARGGDVGWTELVGAPPIAVWTFSIGRRVRHAFLNNGARWAGATRSDAMVTVQPSLEDLRKVQLNPLRLPPSLLGRSHVRGAN